MESTREIPSRWVHVVCSGSQSECRIRFILPTRGFSHVMQYVSLYIACSETADPPLSYATILP